MEDIIHPCGFYKNKAKNIKLCAKQVLENFGGIVPNNMKDLMSLAGIGRKSANVVMLEVFDDAQGIAVDTHAKRISNLIGFSSEKEPEKIEHDLIRLIPKEYWKDVNHLLIWLSVIFVLLGGIVRIKIFKLKRLILYFLTYLVQYKIMSLYFYYNSISS